MIFNDNEIIQNAEILLKINSAKEWVNNNCGSNIILAIYQNLSDWLEFIPLNDYILVKGSCSLYINTSNVPSYIKFDSDSDIYFQKCVDNVPLHCLAPGEHTSIYITDYDSDINLVFPEYHLDIGHLFIRDCKKISLDIPLDNYINRVSIYNSNIIKYNVSCSINQLDTDGESAKSLLYLFMKDLIAKPNNIKIY